jgi:predicted dinucleotide-utilizing enzyme
VQGDAGVVDEALEKFPEQVHVEVTDAGAAEIDVELQAGPTGQVNHHP